MEANRKSIENPLVGINDDDFIVRIYSDMYTLNLSRIQKMTTHNNLKCGLVFIHIVRDGIGMGI